MRSESSRSFPDVTVGVADSVPLPGGRRLTPQRLLVYGTLAGTDSHPDAEQLITMVHSRDPRVSVATVYNTLRLLVDAGAVLELRGLGPKTRYDANVDEHDHFTCRLCATVEDIPRQWPVPDRLRGAGLRGYRVEDVRAHILGVCASCRGGAGEATRRSQPRSGRPSARPASALTTSPASRRSR